MVLRDGFTLIELLIVIAIIAVLAAMLVPVVTLVKNKANQSANGSAQRGIVSAMVAYQGDNDNAWPLAHGEVSLTAAVSPADAKIVAYASLEVLAAATQLPNQIFKAKGQMVSGPNGAPLLSTNAGFAASSWSSRVAGTGEIGWAYDWAAKADATANRIILADRRNWHKSKVVSIGADTSIRVFVGVSGPGDTIGLATAAVETIIGGTRNPDAENAGETGEFTVAGPDGIYTRAGDGTVDNATAVDGNDTINNGNSRRTWVK